MAACRPAFEPSGVVERGCPQAHRLDVSCARALRVLQRRSVIVLVCVMARFHDWPRRDDRLIFRPVRYNHG
jgi:hypothetical protein